jgi:hypothetical protein
LRHAIRAIGNRHAGHCVGGHGPLSRWIHEAPLLCLTARHTRPRVYVQQGRHRAGVGTEATTGAAAARELVAGRFQGRMLKDRPSITGLSGCVVVLSTAGAPGARVGRIGRCWMPTRARALVPSGGGNAYSRFDGPVYPEVDSSSGRRRSPHAVTMTTGCPAAARLVGISVSGSGRRKQAPKRTEPETYVVRMIRHDRNCEFPRFKEIFSSLPSRSKLAR